MDKWTGLLVQFWAGPWRTGLALAQILVIPCMTGLVLGSILDEPCGTRMLYGQFWTGPWAGTGPDLGWMMGNERTFVVSHYFQDIKMAFVMMYSTN